MVDNLIRLFDSAETEFESNGIGVLPDAESCVVTEERNASFELKMVYPINGRRFSDILMRRILVAKANPYSEPQPFRIYEITKPFNGRVTVNAEHISYDMAGYPVSPFEAESCADAFAQMKAACSVDCPFEFWTDKNVTSAFSITKPYGMRSLLGGTDGSILSVYGKGEYEFDRYLVKLYLNRGRDRGVVIRYGKNLTDLKQEENCSSVYTGVYPYWFNDNNGGKSQLCTLPEKVILAEGTYNYTRILTLDLSSKWTEKPKEDDLRAEAIRYMKDNEIGVPKVSLDVSFEQLAQTQEYALSALLEEVRLCDTVRVEFPALGVTAESKCIKTEYDVLTDKYKKLTLGENKASLSTTIANQEKELGETLTKTYLAQSVDYATKLITGNVGGYVVMRNSDGGQQPNEILIMDTPDVTTAKKVWRWNQNGLGYSKDGINGPYGLAMTIEGEISADFMTTGTLNAISIRACDIKCGKLTEDAGQAYEKYWFELSEDGSMTATKGQIAGFTIDDKSIFKGIDSLTSNESSGVYLGIDGIRLGAKGIFSVNTAGKLTAADVDISGKVIASSGKIAGLEILDESHSVDGNTYHGTILKSKDNGFSIFAYDDSGTERSIITADYIDIRDPSFTNNVSSKGEISGGQKIQGGSVSLEGKSIYCDGTEVIWLDYTPSSDQITATVSHDKWSNSVTVSLKDSSGNAYSTTTAKTFSLKLHRTWSSWQDGSITIPANQSSATKNISGAFWGYEDAYFVLSGAKTYSYSVSSGRYIDFKRHIEPWIHDTYNCGSSKWQWKNVYAVNLHASENVFMKDEAIHTSDRNLKKDIAKLDDKYDALFDSLLPVTYKFKNNTSERTHFGFIAQDVKSSLESLHIDTKDFAGYCEWVTEEGEQTCGIRYGEFISLNTYEIQKLKKRIIELERVLLSNVS